jgi:hypothetical protein
VVEDNGGSRFLRNVGACKHYVVQNSNVDHDLIKIDVKQMGFQNMDWIQLAHIRNKWQAPVYAMMISYECLYC